MPDGVKVPVNLMEAIQYFSDPFACVQFFAGLRWESSEAVCPRCQSKRVSFLTTRIIWKCLDWKKQFSIKVGTILEDFPPWFGQEALRNVSDCQLQERRE